MWMKPSSKPTDSRHGQNYTFWRPTYDYWPIIAECPQEQMMVV